MNDDKDMTKVQVVMPSMDELWQQFMELSHHDERAQFLRDWFPSAGYNAPELYNQWIEDMKPKLGVQTGTSKKGGKHG